MSVNIVSLLGGDCFNFSFEFFSLLCLFRFDNFWGSVVLVLLFFVWLEQSACFANHGLMRMVYLRFKLVEHVSLHFNGASDSGCGLDVLKEPCSVYVGLSPSQKTFLLLALILTAATTTGLCDCIFAIDSCQLEVNLMLFILRSSFGFSSGCLLLTFTIVSKVRGEQTLIILLSSLLFINDVAFDHLHLLRVLP